MNPPDHPRRVYPLSPRDLTEEQLAVVFAMTSRRPEPFDEIAQQVSEERAAGFHERWVLGYGHASVAEHAVLHLAVENVSRLACDTLEDNRLASYTEKSSRFQIMPSDYFHVPRELDDDPELRTLYVETCRGLFTAYEELLDELRSHLRATRPRREKERAGAYNLRIRRLAIDSCRFILPASTLTNVGVTMNARSMEHAVTKLLSSPTAEERELGDELKAKGRQITPTLVKYADFNPYIAGARDFQVELAPTDKTSSEDKIDVERTQGAAPPARRHAGTPLRFASRSHSAQSTALRAAPAGSAWGKPFRSKPPLRSGTMASICATTPSTVSPYRG